MKKRYEEFHCPHELGVFLGFPLNDVKDFINCSNKKCLSCKYWCVYNDVEAAEEIFSIYDRIKEYTANHILNGISSYEIVFFVKNLLRAQGTVKNI